VSVFFVFFVFLVFLVFLVFVVFLVLFQRKLVAEQCVQRRTRHSPFSVFCLRVLRGVTPAPAPPL